MDRTTRKIAPSLGDLDPIQRMVQWAHQSLLTNRHFDRFSRFSGLTNVTNRQTDQANPSISSNKSHPAVAATRTKNKKYPSKLMKSRMCGYAEVVLRLLNYM